MDRSWFKLAPPMERTLADDVKAAVATYAGVVLGVLIIHPDDAGPLLGAAVGLLIGTIALRTVRRARRRRG